MKRTRASQTADFAAAVRATYQYRPERALYEDPFAAELTSPLFRLAVRTPPLRRLVMEKLFLYRLGASLTILSRGRYAEEHFHRAYDRGIRQFIILGAGLDSTALKFPARGERITIYELDHPNTQALKKRRLRARNLRSPHKHHFLPIDFSRDRISDVLAASALDPAQPAYVSWMGVTYYLKAADIMDTLGALDHTLASGSILVLDYMDERLFDTDFIKTDPVLQKKIETFFKFTEQKGEPLLSGFSETSLKEMLAGTNWGLTESVNGRDHTAKYLSGPPDFLWPTEFDHLAQIELKKDFSHE